MIQSFAQSVKWQLFADFAKMNGKNLKGESLIVPAVNLKSNLENQQERKNLRWTIFWLHASIPSVPKKINK
jgi:hypothetical protein